MKKLTEQELVTQCKQGSNAARKLLYEQYASRLFAICLRYLANRNEAEDMLHDGFLKLFSSFDKFTWRGEGSLRAWMERLITNECLQYLRKRNKENLFVSIDECPLTEEPVDTEEIEMIPQNVLMKFIQELPDGYRMVFNLYVFEDKSHKEIADLLGINEKSSASQFFRAKKTLGKRIKEWMKNNG